MGERVGPPVRGDRRPHAHDPLVRGRIEETGVVLHPVEAEVCAADAHDVPAAPVAQGSARLDRRGADDREREHGRDRGCDGACRDVGRLPALSLQGAGQDEHAAGEQEERHRRPDVARGRVGGEAEAEQDEEDDDRRQRLAQAQRQKGGQPDRRVHDQREQKPHVGLVGDVEREDVQGVGLPARTELLHIEGELAPGSMDIRGHGHLGASQQIRADGEQDECGRPGPPAHDAGTAGQRRHRGGPHEQGRHRRGGDRTDHDGGRRCESGEGGGVEGCSRALHRTRACRPTGPSDRATCRSSLRLSGT